MRVSGRSMGLVAIVGSVAVGCSAILGIGDLPGPGGGADGGASSTSGSGGSSSSGSSSGVTASGAGASSSGVTASGGVASSGGTSNGGTASSGGRGDGAAGGSGSSGGGHAADVAAFIGTWQTVAGTQTLSHCTNAAADQQEMVPTTIVLTFTPGTTSDLIGTYSGVGSSGCTFLVNVTGTTARAVPGQMCTETSQSETDVVALTSYTFTITGGNAADEVGSGTVVDETNPVSCNLSSAASYSKE